MLSDMKKCPFCAERIQANAQKCRFCGEFLNQKIHSEASSENIALPGNWKWQNISDNRQACVPSETFHVIGTIPFFPQESVFELIISRQEIIFKNTAGKYLQSIPLAAAGDFFYHESQGELHFVIVQTNRNNVPVSYSCMIKTRVEIMMRMVLWLQSSDISIDVGEYRKRDYSSWKKWMGYISTAMAFLFALFLLSKFLFAPKFDTDEQRKLERLKSVKMSLEENQKL